MFTSKHSVVGILNVRDVQVTALMNLHPYRVEAVAISARLKQAFEGQGSQFVVKSDIALYGSMNCVIQHYVNSFVGSLFIAEPVMPCIVREVKYSDSLICGLFFDDYYQVTVQIGACAVATFNVYIKPV